jgi:beta-phosphoglucomutase-like phosphatase (HAD superfamily)
MQRGAPGRGAQRRALASRRDASDDQLGVPLEPEQINELVVAARLGQYRRRLPLLPGAVVAVRRLADRWPLGLASSANRPVIDAVLEQAGITDCFAVTVSGDEVAAGKPAP